MTDLTADDERDLAAMNAADGCVHVRDSLGGCVYCGDLPLHRADPANWLSLGPWHIGRSWHGHELEDACPCISAPCGLVDAAQIRKGCEHHDPREARTERQIHAAKDCDVTPIHQKGGAER